MSLGVNKPGTPEDVTLADKLQTEREYTRCGKGILERLREVSYWYNM